VTVTWLGALIGRLKAVFTGHRLDEELDEELRFHLQMATEENLERGMSPGEARRRALQSLGGLDQTKERVRDQRGFPGLELLGRDLAHAWGALRRRPGYTAAAILSLALGIGANTAVFSLLDALVLRPLPYPEADRLVHVYQSRRLGGRFMMGSVSAPVLRDWRERAQAFSVMGAFMPGSVNLAGEQGAERVAATLVEPEVFQALAIPPLLGTWFRAEHTTPGADRVVVLSHRLWQDRFGGRQAVVGQTLRIDAADYVVAGVMPAGFDFPPRTTVGLYVPMLFTSLDFEDRGLNRLSIVARIKPGVPLRAAQEDLTRVSGELEAIYPNSGTAALRPLHGDTVGRTALLLLVLGGTVGFVLLLACANVAHMVLARANARRHEFAVRLALGARRTQIMRMLVAEGLLLAIGGGLLGLAACRWVLDALMSMPENPLSLGVTVSVSWPVLGYCALVSVLTALGVSVVPAIRLSRQALQSDLGEAVPSSRRRAAYGNTLITVEVALAVVLVIGAGMLVRSLRALTDLDLGFEPGKLLTMRVTLPPHEYPDVARIHAFYDRLLERLSVLPGVEAVGLNNLLPVQMAYTNMDFTVEGWSDARPGYEPFAEHRTVNPDFFRAMGIPIVAGHAFTQAENRPLSGVIIISEQAAKLYWPDANPVGKRMAYGTKTPPDRWMTIVGVAADIKSAGLGQPAQPILYAPYRDFDFPIQSVSVIVRTVGVPTAVVPAVRRAVQELDSDVALYWVSTMDEVIARATRSTRFLAILLAAFSVLAVILAIVGVYGVMSYVVTLRHREIGMRMALGASQADVLWFVLGRALRRAVVGVAIGMLWAVMLSFAIRPFLIGIWQVDVVAHASTAAAVLLVALMASAIPALRASRVDPVEALRHA
jgi:putative ABC transport system permease protein